jgi:glycosyltransferase involved in cell wall biosynthesis
MKKPKNPSILYVSSFPPRECGIATFTRDLTNAIDKEYSPEIKSKILALNVNGTSIYNYPRKVVKQINETEIEDYINCANDINRSPDIKLVNIQHEYGLYGGDWGDYLLFFLEMLNKPIIITMHTVLPEPDEKLLKVTKSMTQKAVGLVVMTKTSAQILEDTYGIPKNKIKVIPHGVHHIAFPSKTRAKKKLNLSGHTVLSSFGMLNRDKGYEYVIEALPEIVQKHPDVIYLILGETHPVVRREEGEIYRNKLKNTVMKYNLKDNVKFYDKYLDLSELIDFLKATDIYMSPTLNPLQAVSGTISYALSCACPIIATANQYAKDVVNHERGILVRFQEPEDIKQALFELLADTKARREMKKNSYFYSRHMTWQNVALSYFNFFNKYAKIKPQETGKLPTIKLDYIKNLTDNFGIIQFANHTKPDIHSGYCLDDNSRALLVCAKWYDRKRVKSTLRLAEKYLDFIKYTQKKDGKFHNFVGYGRDFNDKTESEDSFGRTIWTLGYCLKSDKLPENLKDKAERIYKKSLKWSLGLTSLRAVAFAIIGFSHVAAIKNPSKEKLAREAREKMSALCDRLVEKFENQAMVANGQKWEWFEDCLTYSNYKLPEALFRAYTVSKNKTYLKTAQKSIDFLNNITFEKPEYFSPIGQDGWYFRNGKRAYFDQQPEDTALAVEALAAAYRATGKKDFKNKAELTFNWFLGKNHLSQMVYDEATGGSYDGLGKYSLNFNQGAESSLSYLLARLAIEKVNK